MKASIRQCFVQIFQASLVQGSGPFTLTVNGTGFATGAVVKWNGSARTTAFVSATKVTAAIQASDLFSAGSFPITVSVGAVTSNAANFAVTASSTAPKITGVSPFYVIRFSAPLTMTVSGTNFLSGAVVNLGGTNLTTTFVSATQLTAAIPTSSMSNLGTFQVQLVNPSGLTSNKAQFTVGPNTHPPLAYGFFNKDGSMGAGSVNIRCTWSTTDLDYQCTISGESFWYSSYVVNATYADINTVGIVTANSLAGKLVVRIYKVDGTTKIQAPFYLTVFKP